MDEIIKIADGLVKYSQTNYELNGPKYSNGKWKYCVALAKCGWKAVSTEQISNSDAVMIKWQKEGKQDVNLKLSFTEQCLWLRYLEESRDG